MIRTIGIALAGLVAATASAAESPAADTGNPQAAEICRVEKPKGSNIATRVCRSQAEWDRGQAQADLQRLGCCSGNENACRGEPR